MANNPYVNKVVKDGATLIDISSDTVSPSSLAQGYTAHDASGAQITGTMTGGSMVIRDEEDEHGGVIRHITAGEVVTGVIEITENGTYNIASYADADVNVPAPTPSLQSKTKIYTPSEMAQSETVSADSGYDGLSSVNVNVGAISSIYVGSDIARKSSTDLTVSGATVTAPAGYYADSASKSVASVMAGTPTASKGTVSNHSISVTPSVTNTTGYISGGTKTGTAVSVAASELVSGTYTVSASGTEDVTNYASISVPAQTLPTAASSTSSGIRKATISRSTSNQYINIPTGYNGSASYYQISAVVNGTEGTPTATKGTVSNHSISVTPSVTNTAGYISGSTKTGTAVTISASELVSGNKAITENGIDIDVTNYATISVEVDSMPIGTISMFAGATAPTGYLLCQGQAVSRTTYANLFTVIGTTYGTGNGSTTFNLPNLQGRFALGKNSSHALASTGGAETVTLSTNEIPAHTHGSKSLTGSAEAYGDTGILGGSGGTWGIISKGDGGYIGPSWTDGYAGYKLNIDATHEHNSVGGGADHENMPPYQTVNYIIKY